MRSFGATLLCKLWFYAIYMNVSLGIAVAGIPVYHTVVTFLSVMLHWTDESKIKSNSKNP